VTDEHDPGDAPRDLWALAELDAGLPDPAESAHRRAAAAADPDAAVVLDALAATRAELAALPTPEVPPEVAARWAAALDAESRARQCPQAPDATVPRHRETHGRSEGRPGRHGEPYRGRGPWRRSAAAAVVLLVGVGLGAVLHRPAPAVTRVELAAVAREAVGTNDVGALTDPTRRDACLRAVAPAAAGERLLGGRRVVLDGRPGVLLVLATGTTGRLRIVTVDPGCGGDGGTLLAQLVTG
jgi:hypothetical protein